MSESLEVGGLFRTGKEKLEFIIVPCSAKERWCLLGSFEYWLWLFESLWRCRSEWCTKNGVEYNLTDGRHANLNILQRCINVSAIRLQVKFRSQPISSELNSIINPGSLTLRYWGLKRLKDDKSVHRWGKNCFSASFSTGVVQDQCIE